jgi:uncharacterized MnhB-related membrane protein
MLNLILVIAVIYCAFQVMNSARLLNVTIWLAFTSALVAILIYRLGAPHVAVIELSVGAGLVTVLFVFAFSIVGEATFDERTLIPRPLVWLLILVVAFVIGWYVFPLPKDQSYLINIPFGRMLWEHRGFDVIAQMVLIFSGVMGLIGLLSEARPTREDQPLSAPEGNGTDQNAAEEAKA